MIVQYFSEALVTHFLAGQNILWSPERPDGPQPLLSLALQSYVPFIYYRLEHASTKFHRRANLKTDIILDLATDETFERLPRIISHYLRVIGDRFNARESPFVYDFQYMAIARNLCIYYAIQNDPQMIGVVIGSLIRYFNSVGFVGRLNELDDHIVRFMLRR